MRRLAFLATLFLVVPFSAQALALVRPPYIQMCTTTECTIKWTTDGASDSDVCYAEAIVDVPDTCENNPGPGTEHEVVIDTLAAGTKYFYSVGDDTPTVLAGPDANHYFTTQPAADSIAHHRILFMSDIHSGIGGETGTDGIENTRDGYLSFVGSRLADLILLGGDNAGTTGTEAEYTAQFFTPLTSLLRNTVVWPAMGNHECVDGSDNTAVYTGIFKVPTAAEAGGVQSLTEQYYSFDYGNIHVAVLDIGCSARAVGGTMYDWLVADLDLAANTQEWTIVVTHYPPYSKGDKDSDVDAAMTDVREDYGPIFESLGVDLVIGGHSHSYERSMFLNGHYGDSDTFDADTYAVDSSYGGCCKSGIYRKLGGGPVANSGTVYVVAGVASTVIGGGTLDHPAMVKSLGAVQNPSPPGDGDQGSLLIDIRDDVMNVHWVGWRGAALDHFSIVHRQ